MKKNFMFSILLLTLMMLSVTALPTSATDYTKVGVKVGDTADYNYSNPQGNGTPQISFQRIAGTKVTINIKTINSNGSITPDNIVTGNVAGTIDKILLYLVASNLGRGDFVKPGEQGLTIDNTTTMNIAGSNRTIIHVREIQIVSVMRSDNFSYDFGSYYFDAYWDKATGLGIKSVITVSGFFATGLRMPAGSYITNLTSTTAFNTQNPINPTIPLAIAGAVTATLFAVTIMAFVLKKQKTTTSN